MVKQVARLAALAAAPLLALGASLVSSMGCSSPSAAADDPHPEAVVVRYYAGGSFVRACGGTLISPNVVVTAAHCADKTTAAVVVAPSANARATVWSVYTYDWAADDSLMNPATRNDLALLALRTPLEVRRYASIQKGPCAECAVTHVGRAIEGSRTVLVQSGAMRVAKGAPAEHPLTQLFAAPSKWTAGGAVYNASASGTPLMVGVLVGTGAKSGSAYLAPLGDPLVQRWVRGVVKTAAGATPGSTTTKSLHLLDDPPPDPSTDPGSSSSSSSSSSSGDPAPDPVSSDNDAGGAPSTGDDTPPPDAPPPGDAITTDPPSNQGDDEGGVREVPVPDPSDDLAGPRYCYADQGGQPQKLTIGGIAGVGSLKSLLGGGEVTTVNGDNSVTVASPDDPVFDEDPAIAKQYEGVANIYNSHGIPGGTMGDVAADQLRQYFADDTKPLIVADCFSGAPMTGGSAIRRMMSAFGDTSAAERTYGCTGYTTASTDGGFQCTGAWVNANGRAVPAAERQRLNLNQSSCSTNSMQRNKDCSVTIYWTNCTNADDQGAMQYY